MKRIKWLSLLLVFTVLMGMGAPQWVASQDNLLFANPENEEYARLLDKLGIYSFYSDAELFFEDNKEVKRIEAAMSLVSLLGHDPETASGTVSDLFIDVPDYYEYAGVADLAVSYGLMIGVAKGVFAPEETIKLEHFIKSVVIALGYEYLAQARGGYPTGYIVAADELELLDGVEGEYSSELTRQMLVRIMYNALDVDISVPESMSGTYTEYKKQEGVTALTEYHNIYTNEAVVNSSNVLSLKSAFTPSEKRVLIGDDVIHTDTTDIFAMAGHTVKYYYRLTDNEQHLICFESTDDNNVHSYASHEVIRASASRITVQNQKGKEENVDISASASIFFNGTLLTSGVEERLGSFADKITLIDNNRDNDADVVFIEDYIYDRVDYADTDKEILHLRDASVPYGDKKYVSITDAAGGGLDIEALAAGTIVGISSNTADNVLMIKALGLAQPLSVQSVSDTAVTAADGESYYFHQNLSERMRENIKIGSEAAVAISDTDEIVWSDKGSEAVRLGFLIRAASAPKGLLTEVRVKILSLDSIVTDYPVGEKLRVDDVSMKREDVPEYLKRRKAELNTMADGDTAQIVYYMTNDAGELTSLYTAGKTSDHKLILKYNCKEHGAAFLRDHGYGSAVFASAYALSDGVPIFQVPQENIESYEDKYFTINKYAPANFSDGGSFNFESYSSDEREILPAALVYYKTDTASVDKSGNFFLIEKVMKVMDSDGQEAVELSGYSYNTKVTYLVNDDVALPADIGPGDIGVFSLDAIDNINGYDWVYDYSADTVNPEYVGSSRGDTVAVRVLHVYNAPEGSRFMEAYEDGFENGVPGDDKKILFNLIPYDRRNYGLFSFDIEKEEGKLQEPDRIVDYLHDSENYARIVIRYGNNYQGHAVFYQ